MENSTQKIALKNNRRRKFLTGFIILCAAFILVKLIALSSMNRIGENFYYDLWHHLVGKRVAKLHTVIVAIDNKTLFKHREEPLVFWGPYFAKVIKTARKAYAKTIGIDFLFTISAESWIKKFDLSESDRSRTYDIPIRTQLYEGNVVLTTILAENEKGEIERLMPPFDYLSLLPNLQKDVGIANLLTDPDGTIRHFIPFFELNSEPKIGFATLLAIKANGLKVDSNFWNFGKESIPNRSISMNIGFMGPPKTIPRISFESLLEKNTSNGFLNQQLKDKIVIIAEENACSQDIHQTPFSQNFFWWQGKMMHGAEVHANIIETLLSGNYPRYLPIWIQCFYLLLLDFSVTSLFLAINPLRGAFWGLTLFACIALFSYFSFRIYYILPVAEPQLMIGFCYFFALGSKLTSSERKREHIKKIFGRYVSDEVVNTLLLEDRLPDLGGELVEITALFSDIRNFTTISEKLTPSEVVEMLNTYLGRVYDAILNEGGMIDKFIGDAVMALFNVPADRW